MKYQSYINTLREACDIFVGMAAGLSTHMAQVAEKEISDLFESLENEKSIEYDRIVIESISKADNAFEAVGAGINAILEAIPFVYIGGDTLVLKITEFMRNQSYTSLSSINEVDIEEDGANVMTSTAGTSSSDPSSHSLGSDYPKRTIPAVRRHMAQKSDKVTKVMEDANVANQSDRAIMSVNYTPPEDEYTKTSQGPIDNPSMVDASMPAVDGGGVLENKTSWKILGEDVDGNLHELIYQGTRSWEAIDFAKSQGIFPYEITEVGSMAAVLDVDPQTDELSYPDEPEGEEGVTDMQRVGGGPGLTEGEGSCGRCGSTSIEDGGPFGKRCGDCGTAQADLEESEASVQQTPEINQLAQNKGTTPITQDGDYTQGTQSLAGQDKQPKAKDDGVGDEEGGLPNAKAVSDQNDAQIVEADDDDDDEAEKWFDMKGQGKKKDKKNEAEEEDDEDDEDDLQESTDLLHTSVFSQALNEEQVTQNDDMDNFLLEYGSGQRNIPMEGLPTSTPNVVTPPAVPDNDGVQKGGLLSEMGVDELIGKAAPVPDSIMLNRGKK